jgi:hypothetical protein
LIIAASSLSAQGMSLGPVLGLGSTTLTDVISPKHRTGYTGGIQFQMDRQGGPNFWQTGIVYSTRGAKLGSLGTAGEMVLDYVEVPFAMGWNISIENPWITPFVIVDGRLAARLSCKVTGGSSGSSSTVNCDDPAFGTAKLSGFDLAIGAGGGMSIDWNGRKVLIDARYLMGLRAILSNTSTKNRGLTFGLAYMMPIGRS